MVFPSVQAAPPVNPWPFDTIMPPLGYAAGTTAANVVMLQRCPRIAVAERVNFVSMFVTTAAGNVDLGYYTDDNGDGTYDLVARTGSVAAAGASGAEQKIALLAGFTRQANRDYWRAFLTDSATLSIARGTGFSAIGTQIPLFSIGGAVTFATRPGLPDTLSALTVQNIVPLLVGKAA